MGDPLPKSENLNLEEDENYKESDTSRLTDGTDVFISKSKGDLKDYQSQNEKTQNLFPQKSVYVDTTTDLNTLAPKVIYWRVITGAFLMFLSIVSFIYTPFEFLMTERLRMLPGLPAYDWWLTPPDEVLLKVYIFNVTNGEEFLSGTDTNLKMEEVGPFIFLEKLVHTDVVFNGNGTLSYTAHRTAEFLPHLTNVSLNATLLVPNIAVLGVSSFLADSTFIMKMGLNMMVRRSGSSPLATVTPYTYMWNWTDPLIEMAQKFVPSMVPAHNTGILHLIYKDFVDRVTVHIGTNKPKQFFLIDKWRGSDRLGFWEGEDCDKCQGSTEGVGYPQFLTKNDPVYYLRKTICRVVPLYFADEVVETGINAYRWDLPRNTYNKPKNRSADCFTKKGAKPLPSGVSDISPCYFQYPVAVSMPHFLGAEDVIEPKLEGLNPKDEEHGSYVIIEPLSGVPMRSRARSQSNLVVKKLSGFSKDVTMFSDMILPMFWLEYGQQGLPSYIQTLLYITVVVLPATQHWISFIFLLIGFSLVLLGSLPCVLQASRRLAIKYHKVERISLGYFR